MGKEEGILVK